MSRTSALKSRRLTLEIMEARQLMTTGLVNGYIRVEAESKGASVSVENYYTFTRNGLFIEGGYKVVENGKCALFELPN